MDHLPVITVYMSTAEIAESLGVGESSIKRAIEKLRPVLGAIAKNNYGGYLLNENQALMIKQELQSHHNLQSRQIDAVTSGLEENQIIANAMMILQRRNAELQHQAELAEKRALIAESLNEKLMHTSRLYTITEIAKEAGLPSAERLNEFLREKGVQYKVNGTWVPTCKYSNSGYFEIKQEVHDNGFVYYDRKVTQDGRVFILDLLRGIA